MTRDPSYTPFRNDDPPRAQRPREPVWTLERHGCRVTCELRDHGDAGCDAQLLRDGEFYKGRHLPSRAAALAHVTAVRERLEREGWTLA